MDRRQFIGGMAAAGGLLIAGSTGLARTAQRETADLARATRNDTTGSRRVKADDRVVLMSDFHANPNGYQAERLSRAVEDILKMRPLPRAVVAFGDIAYLTGQADEYRKARGILDPLSKAGISLTFGMGNHDRREEFAEVFPEYAADTLLPGRIVHIVKGTYADIIMLDSLQQGADKSTWITEGAIDQDQLEWLQNTVETYNKPFFVAAHHPLNETGICDLLLKCPNCAGYIYGHLHKWIVDWDHLNWSSKRIMPILCLPSTGHWGDIGYVVLDMGKHEAVARLVQSDFYFPKPSPDHDRPAIWDRMVEKNHGAECYFQY